MGNRVIIRFDFQQKILIHVGAIFKRTLCKIRNILSTVFALIAVSLKAANGRILVGKTSIFHLAKSR